MLALAPIPKIGARSTIRLQAVEIKKNTALVAARTNKKWFQSERHLCPCDADNLRVGVGRAWHRKRKQLDVIACRLDAQKWETHRAAFKCACLGQHADIYFAACVGSDRVGKSRSAHYVG